MSKLLVVFIFIFAVFYTGINVYGSLSKRQKWSLTKTVSYSIMCALLAIAVMTLIVILF